MKYIATCATGRQNISAQRNRSYVIHISKCSLWHFLSVVRPTVPLKIHSKSHFILNSNVKWQCYFTSHSQLLFESLPVHRIDFELAFSVVLSKFLDSRSFWRYPYHQLLLRGKIRSASCLATRKHCFIDRCCVATIRSPTNQSAWRSGEWAEHRWSMTFSIDDI